MSAPLFIPLKKEFFDAFARGEKHTEYRPLGPRWNSTVCAIGREVTLSRGYGKRHRLKGRITSFARNANPLALPGWEKAYGRRDCVAAEIGIEILGASQHPTVLDACCGGRMFHFDKQNPDVLFFDKRRVKHKYDRAKKSPHGRYITIAPDVLGDFRALPFTGGRFRVVIFDPPHLVSAGEKSYMALKYGRLDADYRAQLAAGFSECFRVLMPGGILVFKWSEVQIPVSQILALTPHKPLVGQRCGKSAKTHWIIFLKSQNHE